MSPPYVELNASDVGGSLLGYVPLLNKTTRIWSIFVIRSKCQISQRYLPFHLVAAQILNHTAADCYSQMLSKLSPCHAQQMDLLYHSQLPKGKQAIQKVRQHPISWTGTNLGVVFIPDKSHISVISFEMKQAYKNISISTNNNNSFESMRLFKFVGIGTYSLRSRSSFIILQLMCPFCVSCHN